MIHSEHINRAVQAHFEIVHLLCEKSVSWSSYFYIKHCETEFVLL